MKRFVFSNSLKYSFDPRAIHVDVVVDAEDQASARSILARHLRIQDRSWEEEHGPIAIYIRLNPEAAEEFCLMEETHIEPGADAIHPEDQAESPRARGS